MIGKVFFLFSFFFTYFLPKKKKEDHNSFFFLFFLLCSNKKRKEVSRHTIEIHCIPSNGYFWFFYFWIWIFFILNLNLFIYVVVWFLCCYGSFIDWIHTNYLFNIWNCIDRFKAKNLLKTCLGLLFFSSFSYWKKKKKQKIEESMHWNVVNREDYGEVLNEIIRGVRGLWMLAEETEGKC